MFTMQKRKLQLRVMVCKHHYCPCYMYFQCAESNEDVGLTVFRLIQPHIPFKANWKFTSRIQIYQAVYVASRCLIKIQVRKCSNKLNLDLINNFVAGERRTANAT